jgi:hypothetical protein
MNVIFDQHIGIFEEAIPKEWCEEAIKSFESLSSNQKTPRPITTLPLVEDESISLLSHNSELCKSFAYNFWRSIFPLYVKKYKFNNVFTNIPMYVSDFKLQKTLPTEGFHQWHIEQIPSFLEKFEADKNRIVVYTLYLNDVKEGGETEFLVQSQRIKPKQGTLVLFPAGYTHIHRGNPPLSGEKYIMTGWLNLQSPPSNNE